MSKKGARAPLAASAAALLCLMFAVGGGLQAAQEAREDGFSYENYARALRYVNDQAMVDYRKLKADRSDLDAFVRELADLDPRAYAEWDDKAKIAFWINAYNALTLKVIIDHYPIQPTWPARWRFPHNSIRQIEGVWDEIEFSVMGKDMTLDQIEHDTLRKDFNEPRIHMALVCAAMGCPPLRNEPYRGDKLDEQFADQASRFFGNPKKFRVDRAKGDVSLSPIFKWFGEDFEETYENKGPIRRRKDTEQAVLNYAVQFLDRRDAEYLRTADYDVEYLDYDWSLNEARGEAK